MPKSTVRSLKLAAVTLSLVLAALSSSIGHAASNWSERPAWAADGGSEAPSAGKKVSYRDLRYDVSPFSPGSNNLSLDVGQVFLMGDLAGTYSDSIGTQIHYTYGVSDMFGFDASVGYSDHADATDPNGNYSVATLLAGLRTNLAWYDKVVPYATGGLGFYKPSYKLIGSNATAGTTSLSPVVFGLHLGAGVDLELTRQIFFGASLTFHDIFGTDKVMPDGKRMEVGGTYTSFFLRAGVTF